MIHFLLGYPNFRSELLVFGEGKGWKEECEILKKASHQITFLIDGIQSEGVSHEC